MNDAEPEAPPYISAEFRLENPGIFFQFKLRSHGSEPLCAVVAKTSKAMASLKQGNLVPMIYHFNDRSIPAQIHQTRIKTIQDGAGLGFKDHFIICLDIGSNPMETAKASWAVRRY